MRTRVAIRYRGPALDAGRMDVYQAAANMIAFSEFMVAAVHSTWGDSAEARAEVSGFARGSFITDVVFSVGGSAATVFTALSPAQLWAVVQEAFALWKHLQGLPPQHIIHGGQSVTVTNNAGTVLQVRTESLSLVLSEKGAEAARRFVRDGLDHDGYAALEIVSEDQDQVIASATREESAAFTPVAAAATLSDNTVRMTVLIVAAVFQEGNKWRLSDGAGTFNAVILDGDFLAGVDHGERFGKGDALDVDLRIVQTRTGLRVSVERSVVKVHRHITPQEQFGLL
jgi:hypothetical protein